MTDTTYDRRETVDIQLAFPITVDGQDIATVTMRRQKGLDSVKASKALPDALVDASGAADDAAPESVPASLPLFDTPDPEPAAG